MTSTSKIWKELTSIWSNLNNFHSLEVVDRVSETQLQVGENSNWIIWRLKGKNSFSADTVFIRRNLTSRDVRFWRINRVLALSGLRLLVLYNCSVIIINRDRDGVITVLLYKAKRQYLFFFWSDTVFWLCIPVLLFCLVHSACWCHWRNCCYFSTPSYCYKMIRFLYRCFCRCSEVYNDSSIRE